MIEINGVVYAESPVSELIRVRYVKPLEDFKLLLTFTNGKQKVFDMSTMIEYEAVYQQLNDLEMFNCAYVEHGTVAWSDDIDIDPDTLYKNSVSLLKMV